MSDGQNENPAMESCEAGGHKIDYRKAADLEEVAIDGETMPFFRVGDKYQLERAAYEDAHDTLLDAAKAFAKTLPVRTQD